MKRSPKPTLIIFVLLGGLLVLELLLPMVNLLFHADWSGWMAALLEPGAGKAPRTSALTFAIAVVIMTLSAFRSDTYR